MAHIWKDRVLETSTSTGTGDFTLAGAITGYRAFSAVCSTSDTAYYSIVAVDGSGIPTGEWETGLGTYSAANTLTRTTVLESSNAGAAVNFSAGTKRVGLTLLASKVLPWSFRPPTAASFTLTNSDGANLTLADDPDVGLTIDSGAGVTGTNQPSRLAYRTLTTPTSAWDMVVKLPFWMPTQNYSALGIFVYNSTSNRSLRLYSQSSSLLAVSRYSAMGTWSSDLATPSIVASTQLKWMRIAFDGTDYKFYVSADGKLWSLLFTEPAASYLNASGGNGDRVGLYMMVARTTGPNIVASVPYFSLTGAGV